MNNWNMEEVITRAQVLKDCMCCGKYIDSDWKSRLIGGKLLLCGECFWWLKKHFMNIKEGDENEFRVS